MENFEDFKKEVIAEIKANPHLYPSICRRMVRKIEEQQAEVERLTKIETAAKAIADNAEECEWEDAAGFAASLDYLSELNEALGLV